jgi:ribosomal-protein-alanine N-acetyltransferase
VRGFVFMSEYPRPALEFVRIQEWHIPIVLEIEREAYLEPWTEGMFRQEVNNPLSQFYVVLFEGTLIGYAGFWEAADEAHITSVTVGREHRGRGFGREELRYILELAAQHGLREATLEVRPSNVRAQNLYKSLGFREIGRRKGYYAATGEDAILMARRIVPPAEEDSPSSSST